jgi:hypothetical protein
MDYLILFIIFLVIYLINRVRKSAYGDNIELNVTWFTGVNVNGVVKQWKLLVIDDEGIENTVKTDDPEDLKDNVLVKLTLNNIKQSKFYKIIITYDTKSLRDINFISFYKYNKSNRYEDFAKTDFEDCYEYGNWATEDSCCSTSGTKKYYQDTFGTCSADQIFKTVDCCYKTEWVGNTCDSDGKIRQTREAAGSCNDLSTERELDCCYQTEWVDNTCTPDGKMRQTREAAGNCDDLSTEREELDCCYQTEWANSGSCSSEGKQLQTREAAGNCNDLSTERTIDCNFYGPWTVTDRCSRQGKLIEERTVTRGGNVTKEEQDSSTDCCYQTGWVNSGSCKSNGKQTQVRTSTGPCEDTSTTREIDCCYQTIWSAYGECKDGWAYSSRGLVGSCSGVAPHKKIRCDEMKFVPEIWPRRCGDVDGVKKRCSMPNLPTYTKCNMHNSGYYKGKAFCDQIFRFWSDDTNLTEYNSLGGAQYVSELP